MVMNTYNPIKTYPYSPNRLMVIDWASLSYHQMHSIKSEKRTTVLNIESAEDEIRMWNNHMLSKVLKYIKLFNPKDIICALEGKNVWRFDYVREYYGENATVYYDSSAYYIRFDNCLFKVYKDGTEFKFHPMDIIDDVHIYQLKCKKLNELPKATQDIIWDLYLPNGKPMLPKYKGTRSDEWEYMTPKAEWKAHKEKFAVELGKLYRAKCIGIEGAEGDDVAYVATQYLRNQYDSIIVITKDSDFNQLLNDDKVKIYSHYSDNMTECLNPTDYIETKILSGDSSDNINGIALPNKRKKLGAGNAKTLYENTADLFNKAKTEGWDNQYIRNQKLINFKYIPTHVQRMICEAIDALIPEFLGTEMLSALGINDKLAQRVNRMKDIGYYTLLDREYVEEHPDVFTPSVDISEEEAEYKEALKPKRIFQDMTGVFDDPFSLNSSYNDEVF